MKHPVTFLLLLLAVLPLSACREQKAEGPPPPPFELTRGAIGNYCGMDLTEHDGPKGQIILSKRATPIWFSSARDTIAFAMLPDEDKDIRAIYVSDMAKARDWRNPGVKNWVNARDAFFVTGSRARSGMGAEEAVPFSVEVSARQFAELNGGQVVRFAQLPRDYIIGSGGFLADAENVAPPPVLPPPVE